MVKKIAVLLIALAVSGCSLFKEKTRLEHSSKPDIEPYSAYKSLLSKFPEDKQGYGNDAMLDFVGDEPMTYGLVLSAEAIHYKKFANRESQQRIRKAVQWIIDNNDLDKDGLPGWGLPQPWDAFADGSTNPPNQPYTITTAIVLNGLLDALKSKSLWTDSEYKQMRAIISKVILRWCREMWSDGFTGGYFWYSPSVNDSSFCNNSPSMFLGSMVRTLQEHGDAFSHQERLFVKNRADNLAKAIMSIVILKDGLPQWNYIATPNRANYPERISDLLHLGYTLWGVEEYRDYKGAVKIPWSRKQSLDTFNSFWGGDYIYYFPQNIVYSSEQSHLKYLDSPLWGMGFYLAFCSKWGDESYRAKATKIIDFTNALYGPWPELKQYPRRHPESKNTFYPRQAAHVLYGMAYYNFND
ncbi:MAG: hypothetical protein ACYSSI_04145 [Planctomycetota bacterium]